MNTVKRSDFERDLVTVTTQDLHFVYPLHGVYLDEPVPLWKMYVHPVLLVLYVALLFGLARLLGAWS